MIRVLFTGILCVISFSCAANLQWDFPKIEDLKEDVRILDVKKSEYDQRLRNFNNSLRRKNISSEELEKIKIEKKELAKESLELNKKMRLAKQALGEANYYKKSLYIEKNRKAFILSDENQGIKMSSIGPSFFSGKWKVIQSLYVHLPSSSIEIFFRNNEDATYDFFIADEKTRNSVEEYYKNFKFFKFPERSSFFCMVDARKEIQNELLSVFLPTAFEKLKYKIPAEFKEGSKDWLEKKKRLISAIKISSNDLYKKYPHKLISFVKTKNNSKIFYGCGQYLYVGRKHKNPNFDFYLSGSNWDNTGIDIIDHNKFILYVLDDGKFSGPGRYAIFERL